MASPHRPHTRQGNFKIYHQYQSAVLFKCSNLQLRWTQTVMLWTQWLPHVGSWQLCPNFGEDVVAGMTTSWIHLAWCHPKVRSDLNNVLTAIWERLQHDRESHSRIQLPASETTRHLTSEKSIHLTYLRLLDRNVLTSSSTHRLLCPFQDGRETVSASPAAVASNGPIRFQDHHHLARWTFRMCFWNV